MVLIKGTTEPFMMGDVMGDNDQDDETVHPVMLSDFYLSKYALTLGEFKNFIAASRYQTDADKDGGSDFWNGKEWEKQSGVNWQCDTTGKIRPAAEYNHPVIHVSWNDAISYCNWLSKLEGLRPVYDLQGTVKPDWTANGYRLPTEAEWEYAAREGGKKVRFGNGKNIADPKEINFAGSKEYKKDYSVVGEYRYKTVPVGSLQCPNALGLHDMSGNVVEWCWDWYGTYPTVLESNPKGPDTGSNRVFRGGSWYNVPQLVRTVNRGSNTPVRRFVSIGFRLARTRTL
jgi:formylglycine-generating enzyme